MPRPSLPRPLVAAIALPPLVLAALLAAWGVDLPYWDQFALVPHLAQQASGDFQLGNLWLPHNEHRLFVPQAIMLTLASWSDWNVLWELWFQYGLAVATLVLLLSLLRDASGKAVSCSAVLIFSLMVFSPVQWRNWIWGWQIQIFLVVLSTVATVWLLARVQTSWLRVATAATAATVGSLSFANGLLIWPLALPLVVFGRPSKSFGDRRPDWAQAGIWLVTGAAVWAFYLHGFVPSVDHGPTDEGLWRQFLHFGAYVVLYLAAPGLRFHDQAALWIGFVLVAAAMSAMVWAGLQAALRRDAEAVRKGLPWWSLSAFAVASAAITALGRLDLGIGQALSSRYVTIGNLFWLGLIGWLVSSRLPARRAPSRAMPISGFVVVGLLLINAAHGVYHFQRDSQARSDLRRQILDAESVEDMGSVPLQLIHPSPEEAASHLTTLRQLELGPYRR